MSIVLIELSALGWNPTEQLIRSAALCDLVNDHEALARLQNQRTGPALRKRSVDRLRQSPPEPTEALLCLRDTLRSAPWKFLLFDYFPAFTTRMYVDWLFQNQVVDFNHVRLLGLGGDSLPISAPLRESLHARLLESLASERLVSACFANPDYLNFSLNSNLDRPFLLSSIHTRQPIPESCTVIDHSLDFLVHLSEWMVWSQPLHRRILQRQRLISWSSR